MASLLSNIGNFVTGNYYHLLSKWDKEPNHIKEQAIFRMSLCKECLDNQSCLYCGCTTPNMFYSPSKEDAKQKWGKMLPPQEWEAFKRDNPQIYELFTTNHDTIVTDRPGHIHPPTGPQSDLSEPDVRASMGTSTLRGPEIEAELAPSEGQGRDYPPGLS